MNERDVKVKYQFNQLFFKYNKRIATYRSIDMRTNVACCDDKVLVYKEKGNNLFITLYIENTQVFELVTEISLSNQDVPQNNILLYLSINELISLSKMLKGSIVTRYTSLVDKRVGNDLYMVYHYPKERDGLDEYIFVSNKGKFFVDKSLFYKNNPSLFKFIQNFTTLYDVRLYESLSNDDFYYSLSKNDNYEFILYYDSKKENVSIVSLDKTNNIPTPLFFATGLSRDEALSWAYEPIFRLGLKHQKDNLTAILKDSDFDVSNMAAFISVFDMYTC